MSSSNHCTLNTKKKKKSEDSQRKQRINETMTQRGFSIRNHINQTKPKQNKQKTNRKKTNKQKKAHFKVLKEKNCQPKILYPVNISCKNEGEIKIF